MRMRILRTLIGFAVAPLGFLAVFGLPILLVDPAAALRDLTIEPIVRRLLVFLWALELVVVVPVLWLLERFDKLSCPNCVMTGAALGFGTSFSLFLALRNSILDLAPWIISAFLGAVGAGCGGLFWLVAFYPTRSATVRFWDTTS